MFKNMSLAAKLGAGFGIIVIIAIVLGAVGVVNMKGVQKTTYILENEGMPQVSVVSIIESTIRDSAFEMRGYIFTHEKQYIDNVKECAATIQKTIEDAKALAARSKTLDQLRQAIVNVEGSFKDYVQLIGETEKTVVTMDGRLDAVVPLGKVFLDNLEKMLSAQEDMVKRAASGTDPAATNAQVARLAALLESKALFMDARKLVWQGMATRDTARIESSSKPYEAAEAIVARWASTEQDIQLKRMAQECCDSIANYRKILAEFVTLYVKLDGINKVRGVKANEVIKLAGDLAK